MSFLAVVFVVLMLFWLLWGCYWGYAGDPAGRPGRLGNSIIPWACVAIVGYVLFTGDSGGSGPRRAASAVPRLSPTAVTPRAVPLWRGF